MTVSDKKWDLVTPIMNEVEATFERIGEKIEKKAEKEWEENPQGLFSKIMLCVLCCGRILLGDSDADVMKLKLIMGDNKLKRDLDKEIVAFQKRHPKLKEIPNK